MNDILGQGKLIFGCSAWNTDTGICLAILKGHSGVVRGVQFDNSKIISCSMDKTIRIWSLKTFECVRVIEGKSRSSRFIYL